MKELLNKLPKELRDIIEEYNIDHRPLMKRVLQELTKTNNKCNICKIVLTNDNEDRYYGLYIYTWNRHKNIYCSLDCCEVADYGKLKARRKWLDRINNL